MGDDHVPVGAGLLVERGARADPERLRHIDLDMVDVIAVPDRLEEAAGEAQGEDVLRRLHAEEVVDAEDPLLAQDLMDDFVELAPARQVGPKRLLHDHPRTIDQAADAEHVVR